MGKRIVVIGLILTITLLSPVVSAQSYMRAFLTSNDTDATWYGISLLSGRLIGLELDLRGKLNGDLYFKFIPWLLCNLNFSDFLVFAGAGAVIDPKVDGFLETDYVLGKVGLQLTFLGPIGLFAQGVTRISTVNIATLSPLSAEFGVSLRF